ncbi:DNA polymerase subunit gamma-1, mitochondrial [Chironomus tepperi]|uniref:DNA polymerase subunit gamma-1, mitochondrial n=1 Tax=Chironomus tepperi TaxID=113505 RepID=UPI00391FC689
MGIQMINEKLSRQIFGNIQKPVFNAEVIEKYRKELVSHGITNLETPVLPDVDLKLPKLMGSNIEEHFYNIAKKQVQEYEKLIKDILIAQIPQMPKKWIFVAGWTCYDAEKGTSYSVPYPQEDILVFDVEVCMNAGSFPVIATAVGPKHWYSWTNKKLINLPKTDTKSMKLTPDDLIPMESTIEDTGINLCDRLKKPRLVIGHNVSFDRARIKEQYWLESTGTRFLDTMALHVCVSGVTSYQRAMMKSHKELSEEDQSWGGLTSLNSLKEVHKLYCKKEETLDKEIRNIFMEGSLKDIRNDFQNLMTYCANDVIATNEVTKQLYPLFEQRFPHPATLAGMFELGLAYLPINSNWNRYINEANLAYEDLDIESKALLSQRADHACRLKHNDEYKNHLWMWDQDWSEQELKLKKGKAKIYNKNIEDISNKSKEFHNLSSKFLRIMQKKILLPARRPLLPGYPLWYRNLCVKDNGSKDWTPGVSDIGTGMQIAPKLLSLCWEGFPLHFIRGEGWGFLMPIKSQREEGESGKIPLEALVKKCPLRTENMTANESESCEAMASLWTDVEKNISKKSYYNKKGKKYTESKVDDRYCGSGVWCNIELENCFWFFKLPHKDGKSKNVGNPLAKDFINKFSENVLTGEGQVAERVIEIARMLSYWRNNRDRIMGQMKVWLPSSSLPKHLATKEMEYGAIIPQVVVCGTLTRRAMEPTWMTASNSKFERIGSELRGMVQAPENYKIVGADVDSQELWIASLLGDTDRKIHGSTAFGWMTLSGTKSNGTDLHTITAKAVGISRDHAKVINYARIYGAGQNFAQTLLKQFNPSISDNEAKSKAMKMFAMTKGKKVYYPLPEYEDEYPTAKGFSQFEAMRIASNYSKNVLEMFSKSQWHGGSESAMFNKLEEIADSELPVTPFLKCRLSRALEPQSGIDDRFLPTRINWVVQSGAVDFLHLMLVSMRWIMGDKIRFCLSFHDEVRYIVKDEDADKTALAMHVTNLLTRSFCASKLGFCDLPQSIAFFTSVEIDKILRKEAENDCKTPSNLHGFTNGYSINFGESVDVYEAVKRVGNDMTTWKI